MNGTDIILLDATWSEDPTDKTKTIYGKTSSVFATTSRNLTGEFLNREIKDIDAPKQSGTDSATLFHFSRPLVPTDAKLSPLK